MEKHISCILLDDMVVIFIGDFLLRVDLIGARYFVFWENALSCAFKFWC